MRSTSEFAPPRHPFRPTPTRACLLLINFSSCSTYPPAPSLSHSDVYFQSSPSHCNFPLLSTMQHATPLATNNGSSIDPSCSSSSSQSNVILNHSSKEEDRPVATQTKRRKITNRRWPLSEDPQATARLPEAHCPCLLDFKGTWWNSQALFAADTGLQGRKHGFAWSLLNKVDFAGFSETHSTHGTIVAASLPSSSRFFWSHSSSRSQAGIALAVKHSFLQHFNPVKDTDWVEIEPGRVARLSLHGANGSLDLVVCYFPTGSASEEHKRLLIHRLSTRIAPRDTTLSVLMGDWNFVMRDDDRFCRRTLQSTGQVDRGTARCFQDFLDSHKLHELEQPAFTHENSTAHSRIDRIYTNHHVADQLDRHFAASVLAHTKLSTHRPITFSRSSRAKDADSQSSRSFPTYVLRHPKWKSDLLLNYQDKLQSAEGCDNPLHRLEIFKEAMWDVATRLQNEAPPEATSNEDKLTWTMVFIRAAESINIKRMERAAAAYPQIESFVPAGDPNARVHQNFFELKNHAAELARSQLTDELNQLVHANEDQASQPFLRRKQ